MYFSIPNLKAEVVTEMERPWEYEVPDDVRSLTPEQFKREFSLSVNTDHRFLSFSRGQNPAFRVTKDNEIAELHGFFGDYDGLFDEATADQFVTKAPNPRYVPNWWIRTVSGGLRLAWEFEAPIRVSGNAHAADLLQHIAAVVKASKWGADFDQKSKTGLQYMDIGRGWHPLSDSRIPRDLLESWSIELALKKAKKYSGEVVSIPFEKVKELCQEKFGDALPNNFYVGSRCRRFWDAASDNANGCVITESGVYVFVPHDKPFMSWSDILGRETVEEYVARQTSPMLRNCYYCPSGHGGVYWRLRETDGEFVPAPKSTFVDDLMNLTDISVDKPKGESMSPMDRFLFRVREEQPIDCAAPILYEEAKMLEINGQRILNTSRVLALTPAADFSPSVTDEDLAKYPDVKPLYRDHPDACEWDNPFVVRWFPHLHRYLTTLFMPSTAMYERWAAAGYPLRDIENEDRRPTDVLHDRQLVLLLSWLSYFYKQGIYQRKLTQPGQALILAGGVGKGKTFFAEQIVGNLMGGSQEASDYFIDGTAFTDDITNKPVLLIDDKACDTDSRTRAKFTMRVKAMVAKAKIRHHAKFQTPVEIPYRGRLIICCNDDPQSLSVLPNLDAATSDKIIMLRLSNTHFRFDSFEQNARWLARELPFFAKFLMGWVIPEAMQSDRYGVKAYQHESMKQAVAENGLTHTVVEILVRVFETMSETDANGMDGKFIGTAADLWNIIKTTDPSMGPEYIKEIGHMSGLKYALKQMMKAFKGVACTTTHSIVTWTIPYRFADAEGEEGGNEQWND